MDQVDFSRLLSMDYQREWLERQAQVQAQRRQRVRARREAQKQKMLEHTLRARKIAGVGGAPSSKPRFVMKR